MSGQKRKHSDHDTGHWPPRTPPNASSSRGYSSQTSSQPRPPKSARTSYSQTPRAQSGSSRFDPIVINADDDVDDYGHNEQDEDDASQEVQGASQSFGETQMRYVLYGTWNTFIVGVRYYDGYATIGEVVIPRREPNNRYDSNAIQVSNVDGEQIGHLPAKTGEAKKLAPFMDSRELIVEAVLTGNKRTYDCPVQLRLYGPEDPRIRGALQQRMLSRGFPRSSVEGDPQEEMRRIRQAERAAQVAREEARLAKARERAAKKAQQASQRTPNGNNRSAAAVADEVQQSQNYQAQYAAGPSQAVDAGPSLIDIIGSSEQFNPRMADQIVEQFGTKEEDLAGLPKATQPEAISTKLHDFQLQGLHWLLDKESPKLPAPGSKDVVQLWQCHSQAAGAYTNVATFHSMQNPKLASGGILADDMGLGKTIQMISLIMADRQLGRGDRDTKNATLILAPVSVMSNWSTQIEKHVKAEHALRVTFYHGTRKQPISPQTIANYDVVISTYESVSSEWHSQNPARGPRNSGLFSFKWRRIILDEGHGIRNPKAKKAVAVSELAAQSRWVLTGTPIVNNLKDLYSLVRFLRLSGGLNDLQVFNSSIIRPVMQGYRVGNRALQMLMSSICLRRRKDMKFIDLRLPKLTEYKYPIKLLPHEQEKYDAFDAQAKGTLELYRNQAGQGATEAYRHLLETLLRMRQVCNHWKMISEERIDSIMKQLETQGAVDLTKENIFALQKILQLSIDSQEDCAICLDSYNNPVITKCAHAFCTPCIERVIETQHKCPMCRQPLDSLPTSTVKPAKELAAPAPPTQDDLDNAASLESNTSSKVTALMDILKASAKDKDAKNKTIVFSQWTTFLSLLEPHLRAQGIIFTRIDGSMPAPVRDKALAAFDSDLECTVLLASLAVCSVGLNLVAANKVILSDSWWAPAIEDQAVDRVHRLGQKRETTVFRLVVEGSIEENVLQVQERKRQLMGVAFSEKEAGKKKERRAAALADLETLLGGRKRAQGQGQASGQREDAQAQAQN